MGDIPADPSGWRQDFFKMDQDNDSKALI